MVIHCTTFPTPALFEKCVANLRQGYKPLILTLLHHVASAQSQAEKQELGGVEIFDAVQFLAANLLELGRFQVAERKPTMVKLIVRYNAIVREVETDRSLEIKIPS